MLRGTRPCAICLVYVFLIESVRSQLFAFLIACEAVGFVWLRKQAKLARATAAKPRGDWGARSRALRRFATH